MHQVATRNTVSWTFEGSWSSCNSQKVLDLWTLLRRLPIPGKQYISGIANADTSSFRHLLQEWYLEYHRNALAMISHDQRAHPQSESDHLSCYAGKLLHIHELVNLRRLVLWSQGWSPSEVYQLTPATIQHMSTLKILEHLVSPFM